MSQSGGGNQWGAPGAGYPPTGPGSPGAGPTVPGEPWFAPPGYPPGYTPIASGGVVAWEDKGQSLFARWWGTFKEVCFNSKRFHVAASQSDDPWPAVTFAVTTGAITGLGLGLFLGLIYVAIGGIGAFTAMSSTGRHGAGPAAGVFGVLAGVGVGMVVLLPLFYMLMELIGPWIIGGLHHVALLMVGGATRPYSSTVRVVGYSAAAEALNCVPIAGGMLAFGLRLVSKTIGLEETHKCGSGKAIFAAVFPYLLGCLCYCACYILLGAVGFASAARHP